MQGGPKAGSGSEAVNESWARSIRLKELQEELDKIRQESWTLLRAKKIEEALDLKEKGEELDLQIAELKAEEAQAKEQHRNRKAAAAAAAGVLALPNKHKQLEELRTELEQARMADDFSRAVEVRTSMLALQDAPSSSSSSRAARPGAPKQPLSIMDLTDPDFDPRESPGAEFEVPVPKAAPKDLGLTGRAAARYTAMRKDLEEAVLNGDKEAADDLRKRLEVFRSEFLEKKEEGPKGEIQGKPRAGRKGRGKGQRQRDDEQRQKGKTKPPAVQGKGLEKQVIEERPLTASQKRAQRQLEAWQEEVQMLNAGMMDYAGDEDCKEARELSRRREELQGRMDELAGASRKGGDVLEEILEAIDRAANPDSRHTQLAALARLSKMYAGN